MAGDDVTELVIWWTGTLERRGECPDLLANSLSWPSTLAGVTPEKPRNQRMAEHGERNVRTRTLAHAKAEATALWKQESGR